MFGRNVRNVGLALGVFVALALAAIPAFGSERDQQVQYPGTGAGNWQPLGSQPLEFELAYDGLDQGAEIALASFPGSRVGFDVYTDWAWKQLAAGNPLATPVGKGTTNTHSGDNLTWKVATGPSQLYHILVHLTGTEPATFWIDLQGAKGSVLWAVSPPAAPQQAQATPAATGTETAGAQATPQAEATAAATGSEVTPAATGSETTPQAQPTPTATGSETAVAPPSAQPGRYDFWYNGDNLPVEIELAATPGDSEGFNVYTDEQWQHLAANPAIVPVGKGTSNAHLFGHLTWAMKAVPPGLFHVQVYQTGPRPGEYSIAIRGQGVSGPTALTPAQ